MVGKQTKVCSECGVEKDAESDFYHSGARNRSYRRPDCKDCCKLRQAKRYERDSEKLKEYGRNYYWKAVAKDPETSLKIGFRNKLNKYGITEARYEQMLSEQDGKCAICRKEETWIGTRKYIKGPNRLSIDHCHDSGIVRGLLCHDCNTKLAVLERHDWLPHAIAYLSKFGDGNGNY